MDKLKKDLRLLPKLAGSFVTVPGTYYGLDEDAEYPDVREFARKHPQHWLDELHELSELTLDELKFADIRTSGKKTKKYYGDTTDPLAVASDEFIDVESDKYEGLELGHFFPNLQCIFYNNGYDKSYVIFFIVFIMSLYSLLMRHYIFYTQM